MRKIYGKNVENYSKSLVEIPWFTISVYDWFLVESDI
jgi:hypothetical protein